MLQPFSRMEWLGFAPRWSLYISCILATALVLVRSQFFASVFSFCTHFVWYETALQLQFVLVRSLFFTPVLPFCGCNGCGLIQLGRCTLCGSGNNSLPECVLFVPAMVGVWYSLAFAIYLVRLCFFFALVFPWGLTQLASCVLCWLGHASFLRLISTMNRLGMIQLGSYLLCGIGHTSLLLCFFFCALKVRVWHSFAAALCGD